MDEDVFVAKFEGVVAVQVGNFVGEIELVLRPADTVLPAISQAGRASRKYRRLLMHIKPNPVVPVLIP